MDSLSLLVLGLLLAFVDARVEVGNEPLPPGGTRLTKKPGHLLASLVVAPVG